MAKKTVPLIKRVNAAIALFSQAIKGEANPIANLNFAMDPSRLQRRATEQLVSLRAEKREAIRAALTAVIAEHAPGAVQETQDDLSVLLLVVMADESLMAKLNSLAVRFAITEEIKDLQQLLETTETK